jgi:hypothetical protein
MKYAILILLVGTALASCVKRESAGPAIDALYFGGPIYTGVGAATVEAVAVADGRIAATGGLAALRKLAGFETALVDLDGAAMYPGFVDGHAHLFGIGMRELTLNLEGVGSIEELVEIVAANAGEAKPGEVVYGRGWIETGWPEGRFPTRDDLDPASPENPVILVRADGHALVANSAALIQAGIDAATADPAGGRIERDAAGRPTGILIDNAMSLAEALVAAPSAVQREEAYAAGAEVYAAYGWTGLHNMSVDPNDLDMIERLSDDGTIGIRVYNAVDPSGLDALAASGPRASKNARVLTRAVKLYMDGALGSRGAALLAPYADRPDTSGLLLMTPEQGMDLLAKAKAAGVQVATHAIGDRGNRLVLDWYEAALADADARALRWRIEHAQIVDPADIPRFARIGVIASMQPSHAIGDLFFAPARLGAGRLDGAYAWRSLLDSGANVVGGSDAPVERGDPAIEFYAAVARRALDGTQSADWRPQQRLTRMEALRLFTSAAAFASFQEDDLGTIEVGKRADFSVFSKDLMIVPEAEILKAKAVMTVVDGEVVWREGDEPARIVPD